MTTIGLNEDATNESEVSYIQNAIKDLELANDEHIGSCLRDIFENHDLDMFLQLLSERISSHDADIEKVCHHHFEGFMDSFQKLMDAKTEAVNLKSKIQVGNKKLLQCCHDYIDQTKKIFDAEKLECNIKETLAVLQSSMSVFDAYRKLKVVATASEIDYNNALKTLVVLESMIVNISKFKWCESLQNGIDQFRQSLKAHCIDELRTFLEQVATRAHKIGMLAMLKSSLNVSIMDNANLIDFFLRFDAYGDLKEFVSKEDNPETYFKSLDIRDIIDFMPIYRGIYVYSKLGNISELSNLYKRDKRKQLFVIMDTTTSSGGNTHQTIALSRFLFKTFGFFIVEDYILNTTSNLIDLGFYSELHSKAVQKITAVCNNSATQTENSEDLLDIKMLLEITCCTVEDYGFNNSFVHDILQEMKAKYFDSLLKKADLQFTKLTDEENYADVVIRCKEDRDKLSSQHKYLLTDIKKDQQYPITLPFSNLVPKIHSEIYDFIDKLKQFYKNFNPNELWAHVRQVIEKLLIEHLDKFFSSLVDDRSRTLTQLIQLCVNAHYLSQYTACLKLSIADIIGISANQMSSDTLSISFGIFTKFYTKSHQKILSQLKISVDQFLELSNYDWMTVESSGMGSPYLIDLLQFFRTTFDSFKTLPTALFFPTLNRTCQHIALNLEHNLFDPEVKAISYPALEQLELDLIQCEQFVVEMCKSNAEIEEAMKSFHILRQLLDLTLTKDWTTYFAEYDLNKQSSKYGAVKSSTALNVVERLKEGLKKYKGITLPFRTKSTDKDEKKLLSTVCEELAKLSD